MARKLVVERTRLDQLTDEDRWTLLIGSGRRDSPAELRRLRRVWEQHGAEVQAWCGNPHPWGWWRFESGVNNGHAFTGWSLLALVWLENAGQLADDEARVLAKARARRDGLDPECWPRLGLDFDDFPDPLGEATRRRRRDSATT
jgi:hypothetical protein